jgi:hypothetical protein
MVPTAKEFLEKDKSGVYTEVDITHAMIEFAKLHVEAALKSVLEKAEMNDIDRPKDYHEEDGNGISKSLNKNIFACEGYYHISLDDESVYDSYTLTNIK